MKLRALGLLALSLSTLACGPTLAVDGVWRRPGISGDHFGIIVLRLNRSGDAITGLACYTNGGHLIWRDMPVSGRYPSLSFDHFTGEIVSDDSIEGFYAFPIGRTQQWFFQRAAASEYDDCANSPP